MFKKLMGLILSTFLLLGTFPGLADSEPTQEPVTLTFVGDSISNPGIMGGPVYDAVREKLGVSINYIISDADRESIWLASGDLPDMMYRFHERHDFFRTSGQIIALDDLLAAYGQNITKNAPDMIAYSRANKGGEEGKLYWLIPNVVGQRAQEEIKITPAAQGISIRWDYYSELGCPKVTNEDEFLDVIAQILEKHPQTETGMKTYGLSGFVNWALWSYAVPYGLMYGQVNYSQTYYVDANGRAEHIADHPDTNFFNALRFYNKAYRMGLTDPEMFTQTDQNFNDKLNNLQLISTITGAPGANLFEQAGIENSGYYYIPGAFPYVFGGTSISTAGDVVRGLCITKSCQQPERAMQFLNFLYGTEGARLMYSGVQGVHWDYDANGVPVMTQDFMTHLADNTYNESQGIMIGSFAGALNGRTLAEDGYPAALTTMPAYILGNLSTADKHFAAQFDCAYPFEVYNTLEPGKGGNNWIDLTWTGMIPTIPDDIGSIDTLIRDKLLLYCPKIALSDTEQECEAMIREAIDACNNLGMQTSIAYWYPIFEKTLESYKNR